MEELSNCLVIAYLSEQQDINIFSLTYQVILALRLAAESAVALLMAALVAEE